MAQIRRASVAWVGDLRTGTGLLSAGTSQVFAGLPVSWAARTEHADGKTSPEELLAAAHASCFSMALASGLAKAGSPPERLDVTSDVAFEQVDGKWTVISSKLTVRGKVPGLDAEQFRTIADDAKSGCPISRALQGNVALSVDAALD